jgi:hypothetical protein
MSTNRGGLGSNPSNDISGIFTGFFTNFFLGGVFLLVCFGICFGNPHRFILSGVKTQNTKGKLRMALTFLPPD